MSGSNLAEWIGKSREVTERLDEGQVARLAATLDRPVPAPGEPLPGGWHWAWFNDARPKGELGRDGHPKKGGFLPPVAQPRRMWAGGELRFHAPLRVGETVLRRSTISDVAEKTGRTGPLCFVTVTHELHVDGQCCLTEIQNLVYREDPAPDAPRPKPPAAPTGAERHREVDPDPVTMFRYSAVTFNGHRIHYDADYARTVEGYDGLVFHGPLTATLLMDLAAEGGRELSRFVFRASSPIIAGNRFRICARAEGETSEQLWAERSGGVLAMQATAWFQR